MPKSDFVLVRGGGDLATGIALRLHRAGIKVLITELAQPLAVRRTVSFAEAVYEGSWEVEGVKARLIEAGQFSMCERADEVPVLVDPDAEILSDFQFPVVVDARLLKTPPDPLPSPVPLHIGLGPGFTAGSDCNAVVETRRGHTLGRVYRNGSTQPDSGEPEGDPRRVLRAPQEGILVSHAKIADQLREGQLVAEIRLEGTNPKSETLAPGAHLPWRAMPGSAGVGNQRSKIVSPFAGVLRGLVRDGLRVSKGMKIGDVDPRGDPSYCWLVSDKSLAIGGGVLEAILTVKEVRKVLLP